MIPFLSLTFQKMLIIGIFDDYPKYILQIKNLRQSHCYCHSFIYLRILFVTLLWISFCF